MQYNSVTLSLKYPETLTQAYHAGVLFAMAENYISNKKLPSFVACATNFHSLREVFGEELWQLMKAKQKFRDRITIYELLSYEIFLPRVILGTYREFCLGYVKSYYSSNLKRSHESSNMDEYKFLVAYIEQKLAR